MPTLQMGTGDQSRWTVFLGGCSVAQWHDDPDWRWGPVAPAEAVWALALAFHPRPPGTGT